MIILLFGALASAIVYNCKRNIKRKRLHFTEKKKEKRNIYSKITVKNNKLMVKTKQTTNKPKPKKKADKYQKKIKVEGSFYEVMKTLANPKK